MEVKVKQLEEDQEELQEIITAKEDEKNSMYAFQIIQVKGVHWHGGLNCKSATQEITSLCSDKAL